MRNNLEKNDIKIYNRQLYNNISPYFNNYLYNTVNNDNVYKNVNTNEFGKLIFENKVYRYFNNNEIGDNRKVSIENKI